MSELACNTGHWVTPVTSTVAARGEMTRPYDEGLEYTLTNANRDRVFTADVRQGTNCVSITEFELRKLLKHIELIKGN